MKRSGFTLIEMLVVLGIIAVLVAASIGGYSGMTKAAQKTRCQELVANVATALTALYQREGVWPKRLAAVGEGGGRLDEKVAYPLKDYMSVNADDSTKTLVGLDRFGIVTPWATDVMKRQGKSIDSSYAVSSGKHGKATIADHVLYFAVDADGDGLIEDVPVGGSKVSVRATAIVWCGGKDGYVESYDQAGRSDDVFSFTRGQTQSVK